MKWKIPLGSKCLARYRVWGKTALKPVPREVKLGGANPMV